MRPREVARAVTPLELFFDLVYVFTVSQLTHNLLQHVDARGMAETVVLTLAVMYAWFMTVWTSNWLDVLDAEIPYRRLLRADRPRSRHRPAQPAGGRDRV